MCVTLAIFSMSIFGSRFIHTSGLLASIQTAFLVELTNQDRQQNNTQALQVNNLLVEAAQKKADDMASKSYFAHTSPEGITPWHWFDSVSYSYAYAGENLAVNFSESLDVHRAWLASPTHKKNIVDSRFTEIGIATSQGVYKGRPATFVVQLFGTPKSINVQNSTVLKQEDVPLSEILTEETQPMFEIPTQEVLGEITQGDTGITQETSVFVQNSNSDVLLNDYVYTNTENSNNFASESYQIIGDASQLTLFEKIIISPLSFSFILLLVLIFVLIVVLLVRVVVEFKHHHIDHAVLLLGAIVLIGVLLVLQKSLFLDNVIINTSAEIDVLDR